MKQIDFEPVEKEDAGRRIRLSPKERRAFFSTLGRLLRGGVPLLRALEVLSGEGRSTDWRVLVSKTRALVADGKSFSHGLSLYPSLFPAYQIRLIEAGEASGQMDRVLDDIGREIGREEETRSRIREAVAYPAFIVLFGLATVFVLVTFIIPRIAGIYGDFGEELPPITLFDIGLSRWMKFLIPGFLLLAAALGLTGKKYRLRLDPFLMKVPFFGGLLQTALLARLGYLLALLLKSGIPLLRALEAAGWPETGEKVARGETLAEAFRGAPFMSASALALIQAGEESGGLPESLEEISQTCGRELESATRMILKLLEPALILVIGAGTGFVVIAMIYPVLSLSAVVR
jgi:type II secretory pathway component PulF